MFMINVVIMFVIVVI